MNVAAQDDEGIIVSIVVVDDTWWQNNSVPALDKLRAKGFDFFSGPVNPGEVERNIGSWAEWDEWLDTLQPA